MKRPSKVLHLLWRLTLPLRRPLARGLHASIDRSLAPVLQHLEELHVVASELTRRLDTIDRRVAQVHEKLAMARTCFEDNLNPTLEGIVRDLARFETQIELLEGSVSSMKRIGYFSLPLDKGAA